MSSPSANPNPLRELFSGTVSSAAELLDSGRKLEELCHPRSVPGILPQPAREALLRRATVASEVVATGLSLLRDPSIGPTEARDILRQQKAALPSKLGIEPADFEAYKRTLAELPSPSFETSTVRAQGEMLFLRSLGVDEDNRAVPGGYTKAANALLRVQEYERGQRFPLLLRAERVCDDLLKRVDEVEAAMRNKWAFKHAVKWALAGQIEGPWAKLRFRPHVTDVQRTSVSITVTLQERDRQKLFPPHEQNAHGLYRPNSPVIAQFEGHEKAFAGRSNRAFEYESRHLIFNPLLRMLPVSPHKLLETIHFVHVLATKMPATIENRLGPTPYTELMAACGRRVVEANGGDIFVDACWKDYAPDLYCARTEVTCKRLHGFAQGLGVRSGPGLFHSAAMSAHEFEQLLDVIVRGEPKGWYARQLEKLRTDFETTLRDTLQATIRVGLACSELGTEAGALFDAMPLYLPPSKVSLFWDVLHEKFGFRAVQKLSHIRYGTVELLEE